MTVAAALFDLDGTLVDSLQDLTNAVNHMLSDAGRQILQPAEVRQLVGKGARNLVQRALATDAPDVIERGLALFTEFNELHIADNSRLYPGALELLQQLTADGVRLAVVSNKPEALSRLILKTLHVDTYFTVIAGGDSFAEMKPSPLPLLQTSVTFGCCPADMVMVGDSINDIQAGKQAGIVTIGCCWGYGSLEELSGADYLAASLAEIPSIISNVAS